MIASDLLSSLNKSHKCNEPMSDHPPQHVGYQFKIQVNVRYFTLTLTREKFFLFRACSKRYSIRLAMAPTPFKKGKSSLFEQTLLLKNQVAQD